MVFPLSSGGSMALRVGGVWMFCMCVVQFGTRYWDAVYDPGSWLWVFRAPQVAVSSLLSFLPCWALGSPPVSVFGCWRVSLISSLIAGRLGLPFSALGCVTCLVCFHHRARGRGAWCLASCWPWPLALGVLGGSAFGSGSAVFSYALPGGAAGGEHPSCFVGRGAWCLASCWL